MSIFQDVLIKKPGRSLFNLTHEKKFSADWANLYPVFCTEVVPGDTFKISTEILIRTAPLVAPVMHRVNVKMNYFYVPNRLIWSEWRDFITGINQASTYDPQDTSNYFVTKVPPYISVTNASTIRSYLRDGSLADFLGFPTARSSAQGDVDSSSSFNLQVLPFRAYQKIYNDWYRNQNVESEVNFGMQSGNSAPQLAALLTMRKRMWEKDYFTSCLPFAQRGDAVEIPMADVKFNKDGRTHLKDSDGNSFLANSTTSNQYMRATNGTAQTADANKVIMKTKDANGGDVVVNVDNTENLKITMGTINDLRTATKLQRWLEVNARVGGRYIEQVLGHFGIHSSDARHQRAEYLGGWSQPIVVTDVEQTSAYAGGQQGASASTPQGNLAGKGTSYAPNQKPIKCFCEEHGFIIGIMSIIPRTTYQDGLPRMFQRNYKEDYYFPEFANLGEQEVNKAEVFFNLNDKTQRTFDRFGFQERYCEYKYIPSTVHGEFKNTLQFWHLGRDFTTTGQPALNQTFCECNPRTNIFAVTSGAAQFYVNLINHVTALRPMPKQAIPTL